MRFSLRTLLLVMLLGGPILAGVLLQYREWPNLDQVERQSLLVVHGCFVALGGLLLLGRQIVRQIR